MDVPQNILCMDKKQTHTFFDDNLRNSRRRVEVSLSEYSHEYLVNLLMSRLATSEKSHDVLSEGHYDSIDHAAIDAKTVALLAHTVGYSTRDLGDSLLFSMGFFPEVPFKRRQTDKYCAIGRQAYSYAVQRSSPHFHYRDAVQELSHSFNDAAHTLTDLHVQFQISRGSPKELLDALDFWESSKDPFARVILNRSGLVERVGQLEKERVLH